MKEFFNKYKFVIVAVAVCLAVLTGAFFAGGKLNSNPVNNVKQNTRVVTSSTQTTQVTTNTVPTQEDKQKNNSESNKKSDKNTDNKSKDYNKTTSSAVNSDKNFESSSQSKTTQSSDSDSKNTNKTSSKDSSSNNKNSSSSSQNKDKYLTDPVPEGKPQPVEPQEQETKSRELTCTFSISCSTILNNMSDLDSEKTDLVPSDGWILKPLKVTFNEGESVYDVLQRVCKDNKIHMEAKWTPINNSAYIEGINNLYEFDCGPLSGWKYSVNDWFPNYGCSRYVLKDGDNVEWQFTCDLGNDIGYNL